MYLALYRKWRPKTFDDVVGQTHITTTLQNEVKNGKTAHSYLFTGSRGTGKTTCSKILAMAVNCLNPQNGNPCMECENCKGIEDGSILDVLEIDAASNNGVDDVRILREEANYTPAQCKYRVYIIDETHMLSASAFNALLKIMEEPPPHVKFILATTEVHKVPATVLSRCQRFDFTRIKTEDIAKRLLYIAEQEPFSLEEEAAYLIARLADGGMRDALSILDQCTSYADCVNVEIVSKATGLVLRDYLFDVVDMIERKSPAEAVTCVDELYAKSKDLQKLVGELIEHFRNLMLVKTVRDEKACAELVHALPEEMTRLQEQAGRIPLVSILRYLAVLQECLDKISRDFDKRLCVEMALVKLCSPELDDSREALMERIERLEGMLKNGAAVLPKTPSDVPPAVSPVPSAEAEKPILPKREAAPSSVSQAPNARPVRETPAVQPQLLEVWPEIMAALSANDPMMAGVLAGSMAYAAGEVLYIDSPNGLFSSMVKRDNFIKKLLQALEQKTGQHYKIRIKKNKAVQADAPSPLDDIAKAAAELGIEINEK